MSFRTGSSALATLVRVEVIAARKLHLRSSEDEDFPSPYVIVQYNDKKKSTDVIQESCTPRWRVGSSNKVFSFRVNPVEKQMTIIVMDWYGGESSAQDRYVGSLRLNVGALDESGKAIEDWFDIEPPISFTGLGSMLMRLADAKGGSASPLSVLMAKSPPQPVPVPVPVPVPAAAAAASGYLMPGGLGGAVAASAAASPASVPAPLPAPGTEKETATSSSPSSSLGTLLSSRDSHQHQHQHHVGQLQLRVWLEKRKVAIDKSPLWDAVRSKALDQVKNLLKMMTFKDLNQKDQHGDTVLHLAVSRKDWDVSATQILLALLDDERLDVTATNEDDNTAFHYFCQKYGNISVIGPFDRLVERGADVHAVNKFGETPLHKAMFHPSLKLTLLDLLLQRGADPNAAAATGETPLHYAVHLGREDVVKFLLQKGADYSVESNEGKSPYDVAKEENPAIAQRIKDTKEILAWLRRVDLLEYAEDFLAHDIFLYVLPDLTEDYVRRILPEDADKTKVMQAVRRFVREVGSFRPSSQEQLLKEDVLRKLELRKRESILRRSLNDHALKRLVAASTSSPSSSPSSSSSSSSSSSTTTATATATTMTKQKQRGAAEGAEEEESSSSSSWTPNALLVARDSVALFKALKKTGTLRNTRIRRTRADTRSLFEQQNHHQTQSAASGGASNPNPNQHATTTTTTTTAGAKSPRSRGTSTSSSTTATPADATNKQHRASLVSSPAATMPSSLSSLSTLQPQPATLPPPSPLDLVRWEIDPLELEFIRSLGCGASGEVFLGRYQGQHVAIKILNRTQTDRDLDEFKKEFEVLVALKSLHAIRFYGACVAGQCSLVMEYAARGSLFDVMKAPDLVLGWDKFFHFAIDMAAGLADLHDHRPQILHRDFKCLNLLVTEDWNVKLCDFGLSRFNTGSNMQTLSKCRGTYAYLAPEIYDCDVFSTKADVYALAIALWELTHRVITGEYLRPYKEYPFIRMDFQTLVMARKKNLRPTIPVTCPSGLADIIRSCWDPDPRNRLEAIEVLDLLIKLEQQYKADPKKWDKAIRKYALLKLRELEQAAADSSPSSASPPPPSPSPPDPATATALSRSAASPVKHRISTTTKSPKSSPKSSSSSSPLSRKEVRRESAPPVIDSSAHTAATAATVTSPKTPKLSSTNPSQDSLAGSEDSVSNAIGVGELREKQQSDALSGSSHSPTSKRAAAGSRKRAKSRDQKDGRAPPAAAPVDASPVSPRKLKVRSLTASASAATSSSKSTSKAEATPETPPGDGSSPATT